MTNEAILEELEELVDDLNAADSETLQKLVLLVHEMAKVVL